MTRGKYATRATVRREAADVEANEAAYQRQIVRLTQERNEARAELAKTKAGLIAETRVLRAQVSEGTSNLVAALRIELNKSREVRDAATRELKRIRGIHERFIARMNDHWIAEHGAKPGIDAIEKTMTALDPEFMDGGPDAVGGKMITVGTEQKFADKHGVAAARALRKSRGKS